MAIFRSSDWKKRVDELSKNESAIFEQFSERRSILDFGQTRECISVKFCLFVCFYGAICMTCCFLLVFSSVWSKNVLVLIKSGMIPANELVS